VLDLNCPPNLHTSVNICYNNVTYPGTAREQEIEWYQAASSQMRQLLHRWRLRFGAKYC